MADWTRLGTHTLPFSWRNLRLKNGWISPLKLTNLKTTPWKINGWNIFPWRFGSDHFLSSHGFMAVGSSRSSSRGVTIDMLETPLH